MFDAMVFRAAPLCLVLVPLACAARGPAAVPVPAPTRDAAGAPATTAAQLAPLTDEERGLEGRLRETVTHLAVEIGERNPSRSWNLASATDDLARTLEKMGYEVARQGIVMGDDVVQNLECHSSGGEKAAESVFVAAHIDSASGSPGANDDASGAAAVVELARFFQGKKTNRTLRFALLSNGEAPHAGTERAGGAVYGKGLVTGGAKVLGGVCLDGVGTYRDEPKSEHPPSDVLALLPEVANFVAFVGTDAGRPFYDAVVPALRTATLPVVPLVVDRASSIRAHSDCTAFDALGIPTVSITDTGPFRSPHHHQKTDLPAELDFGRMARVVAAVARALGAATS